MKLSMILPISSEEIEFKLSIKNSPQDILLRGLCVRVVPYSNDWIWYMGPNPKLVEKYSTPGFCMVSVGKPQVLLSSVIL